MASLASSGGADTPGRPEPGFRARSRRRRRSSSEPSPTTSATSSEGSRVFAVDKPAGKTSHDVVAHVRRILQGAKVGHAGTLDPDATGVLVLCAGRATKISSFLMESEKEYRGSGRLGIATDTQDASGEVIETREVEVAAEQVVAAATRFVGKIHQTPPMYSALKVGGKKLYRLARAGVEVHRPARPVEVYSLELSEVEPPRLRFELCCSKGTYVRTLIHDLGAQLGCGAHMEQLTRVRSGPFTLDSAVQLDELEAAAERGEWEALLLPADRVLESWHAALLGEPHSRDVTHGQLLVLTPIGTKRIDLDTPCRAYSEDGEFLAILRYRGANRWHPEKVFRPYILDTGKAQE